MTKAKQYVIPSVMDFDDMFARTPNTIVFNEIMMDRTPEEVIEILCDISNDNSDSVASCDCGEMVGNYYDGMKCRICGTICQNSLFEEIRNDSWLEIPTSIKGVLNPQVFRILSKWIDNLNGEPILELVLNMQAQSVPIPNTPFFTAQGFNWFYDNFDTFISYYLTNHPSPTKRKLSPSIRLFLEKTGKAIWCTKLPILSKVIQPIARISKSVRYADADIKDLIRSIFTLRSILLAEKMMKFTKNHVDKYFFRVYGEFLAYDLNIMKTKLPMKRSVLRKQVFGARSHCSGRSVAIPITEPHDSDEIYLPWRLGVVIYKYHILSVLNRRNMSTFEAFNRIMTAINIYDPEIDEIMRDLIAESPYKGLPILMNRNPSLRIGSIQLLFVTKIKPSMMYNIDLNVTVYADTPANVCLDKHDDDGLGDIVLGSTTAGKIGDMLIPQCDDITFKPAQQSKEIITAIEDGTIEVSPLIVKGPNLDFDGDEINIIPLFEMDEVPKYTRLLPAHRTISSDKLTMAGDDISLSSQQYCILSGWVNDPEMMIE